MLAKATEVAEQICSLSPDAVIVTKELGQLALKNSLFEAMRFQDDTHSVRAMMEGENSKEGVKAFKERRKPNWIPSKL